MLGISVKTPAPSGPQDGSRLLPRIERRERDPPLEERAADDGAFASDACDSRDVVLGCDSSGRDDAQPRALDDLPQQVEIGPFECAVAVDRGAMQPDDSGCCTPFD